MEQILEDVQNGTFDPLQVFTGNKDKFLEVKTAIESISNNLPKDVCIQFVMTKLVPTMFDKNVDNSVRDEALEVGLHFLQFVNVSFLEPKDQEDVFVTIEETYIKLIGELRDSNYPNWDKLWVFLIKLSNEKLNSRLSLANKLLRIVEVAFRNSTSVEQRLKAYDCWVELINNCSLNMDYMCSPKQIKLLVTPLKAKFSRIPVVIMKRCDTFVYLLEKLQNKATLCLREFLEFCFGPFDDVDKMRQGSSVPEVCNKSTKVLLELLGHSHKSGTVCLESNDLRIYKPLINDSNFANFAEILVNSVVECCVLLNEWSQESSKNNTIIKCLWQSLLNLVKNGNTDAKKRCCILINNELKRLLVRSKSNESLFAILGSIVDVLISNETIDKLKETVFDVGMHILSQVPADSCSFSLENITKFLLSCLDQEKGSKFDKIALDCFKNGTKHVSPALCDIWLKCRITVVPDNVPVLIWPINNLKNFKNAEDLNSKWTGLYSGDGKTEALKILLIQRMEKLFLDNPLMGSNVVHFLQLVAAAEANPGKDFVAKFMRLIERVLTLPNLPDSDVKSLSSTVLTYCNQNLHFYKSENNDEAISKLCGCLEQLVTIHKEYTVLTESTARLQSSQPKTLLKFSKCLMSFLETLMLNEDMSIANSTRILIELLETKENEPEAAPPSTRSLRIMNMANVTPKPRKPAGEMNNANSRLFNKSLDQPSPLSVRSSRMVSSARKSVPIEKKKKETSISLIDDKSSDYVKIDTEVKIDLNNLSEHQKEMLKKRREDIPALYQDLTQSQSQDLFQSASKSQEEEKSIKEQESPSPKKEETTGAPKKPAESPKKDQKQSRTETTKKKSPSPSKKRKRVDSPDGSQQAAEDPLRIQETEAVDEIAPNLLSEGTIDLTTETEEKSVKKTVTEEKVVDIPEDSAEEASSQRKESKIVEETKTEESKTVDAAKTEETEAVVEESQNPDQNTPQKEEKRETPISKKRNSSKKSPETSVRKSNRSASKRQRVEESNEERNSSADRNEIEERVSENGELETEDNESTGKEEKIEIRKSQRQIKKRVSDNDHASSQSAPDSGKQDKSPTPTQQERVNTPSFRNKKKEKSKKSPKYESVEELLARVDKRIEERRKLAFQKSDLQDGNQNELIPLEAQNLTDNKKNRPVAKARRRLQPSIEPLPTVPNEKATDNQLSSRKPEDVYEFKGEEDVLNVGAAKKSSKKKRKGMSFNRSDYISKRRKKPKKDARNDFAFHVTADSPLPLSESPSLRAVPSQETITILITRSPPESSGAPEDDASPKKRKPATEEHSSEDIIESSQETPAADGNKRKSSSRNRSRSLKQTTIDEMMKPLVTTSPDPSRRRTRSSGLLPEEESSPPTEEPIVEPADKEVRAQVPLSLKNCTRRLSLNETSGQEKVGMRSQRSQSLDKLDYTNDPTLTLKVEDTLADTQETAITDSEQIQQADTLTLSPIKTQTKENLPASPITCDTPDRTTELLNNTFDISPISSAQEEEVVTPVLKHPTNEISNMRVARLLQMVNSNVQVIGEGRRWFGNKHSPAGGSRVRKMRLKKEENLDILTFSREVPSPLTAPASGILKRKSNSVDEPSPAPCAKRKRVNFSDPAITDKKLFIKDSEEYLNADQSESTNDDSEEDKKSQGPAGVVEDEELKRRLRDFCDSNLNDGPLDVSKVKSIFKQLLPTLKAPEVVEVVSDFFNTSDSKTIDEMNSALIDSGVSNQFLDKCVLPMIQNSDEIEEFLPKLLNVVGTSSNDKLQRIVQEVEISGARTKKAQKEIEDHIVNLDCDKMNDLIKTYFMNLDDQKRNDFLVDLMNLASSELPVNKEFVNCHVNILQNFVKKMTD